MGQKLVLKCLSRNAKKIFRIFLTRNNSKNFFDQNCSQNIFNPKLFLERFKAKSLLRTPLTPNGSQKIFNPE